MGVRARGSSTSARAPGSHSGLPDEPVGRGHVFPGALLRDLVPLLPAGAGRPGGPPRARDHLSAARPCSPRPSCRPAFSWTLIRFLGVHAVPSGELSVSPPSRASPEAGCSQAPPRTFQTCQTRFARCRRPGHGVSRRAEVLSRHILPRVRVPQQPPHPDPAAAPSMRATWGWTPFTLTIHSISGGNRL